MDKRTIRTMSMLGSCGAFGMACIDIAERDSKMLVVTADLCNFSGLDRFKNKYENRLLNVGIAEQNLVGIATGLSKEGFNVFLSTYATFITMRALDQIKVNASYMGFPIKIVGITSGFAAGILGATHISLEDIAIMRSLPNMVVLSPADCLETYKCVIEASKINKPVYIRLTGVMNNPIVYTEDYDFKIGKAIYLKKSGDITIIATGMMVHIAQNVIKALENEGITCSLIDMHTIKPLDIETIKEVEMNSKLIVTIEEHNVIGGLGSAVAEVLSSSAKVKLLKIGVEDFYPLAGDYNYQLQVVGLTEDSICTRIRNALSVN